MSFDPISAVFGVGEKLIERLLPDPGQKAAALLELEKLRQSGDLAAIAGQVEINKVEAANASVFVSGWRPFVGWTCGGGLAIQFVIGPLVGWGTMLAGHPATLPVLDLSLLITLLAGMLGLSGLRTYEKTQGVARG